MAHRGTKSVGVDLLLRALLAVGGLVCFAMGTYVFMRANMGYAPWDTLNMGLASRLPISYGTASVGVSLLLILVDVLVLNERIGLGTILDAVIVGKTVDLLNLLDFIPLQHNFWLGLVMMLTGLLQNALGQYLYMRSALCCGPRDSLLVGLGKRVPKVPIGAVNVGLLLAATLAGFLLGGTVGWGTLLAAAGTGISQQLVFRLLRFEPRDVVHENLLQTGRRIVQAIKEKRGDQA